MRSIALFVVFIITSTLNFLMTVLINALCPCEQAAAMREEWKVVRENAYTGGQADLESDVDNTADLQVCMVGNIPWQVFLL